MNRPVDVVYSSINQVHLICVISYGGWNLTFMVCSFCFVVMLFRLELSTLLFCMTLLYSKYAKMILSLTIAIHEFIGCLAFPSELRLLSHGRYVGFEIKQPNAQSNLVTFINLLDQLPEKQLILHVKPYRK